MKGMNDKREITALLTISASGNMLPSQVLFEGKTERCHTTLNFPENRDVWHTLNYWANEATVLHAIDTILKPYLKKAKAQLGLPESQKVLLILDVFRAH